MAGQLVRAGDIVSLWYMSANRDGRCSTTVHVRTSAAPQPPPRSAAAVRTSAWGQPETARATGPVRVDARALTPASAGRPARPAARQLPARRHLPVRLRSSRGWRRRARRPGTGATRSWSATAEAFGAAASTGVTVAELAESVGVTAPALALPRAKDQILSAVTTGTLDRLVVVAGPLDGRCRRRTGPADPGPDHRGCSTGPGRWWPTSGNGTVGLPTPPDPPSGRVELFGASRPGPRSGGGHHRRRSPVSDDRQWSAWLRSRRGVPPSEPTRRGRLHRRRHHRGAALPPRSAARPGRLHLPNAPETWRLPRHRTGGILAAALPCSAS